MLVDIFLDINLDSESKSDYIKTPKLLPGILNKINNLYQKINTINKSVYIFRNINLEIINNIKKIYFIEQTDFKIIKNNLYIYKTKKETNQNQFPYINNYHDILNQKITNYKKNNYILSVIQENNYFYFQLESENIINPENIISELLDK